MLRIPERRGLLEEPNSDEPTTQLCPIAASLMGKAALGSDREAANARLGQTGHPTVNHPRYQASLSASIDGYPLFAAVRIPSLERLPVSLDTRLGPAASME